MLGDTNMLELLYKYLYLTIAIVIILSGSVIVDYYQRISRILRILGFSLIVLFIPLDATYMGVLDTLSYPFLLLLGVIGLFVTLYCEGYSRVLLGLSRTLQLPLDIFMVSLFLLYSSSTLIEFVMFWIITELIGFMIILSEGTRRAWNAAIQYLIVGALTADFSLFTLLAVVSYNVGLDRALTYTFSQLAGLGIGVGAVLTILLLLGFIAKAALVPLHFWLPDAYTLAPSPASAVLSGVMEKMSIYGVLRVLGIIHLDEPVLTYTLVGLGVATTIYASAQALVQRDIKRLLSYSTMAYSGVLMSMISVYVYAGFMQDILQAVYALMIAHGLSKSLLFINAGSIELLANTRDIYDLGYLSRIDEVGSQTITIGVMSLLGVPSTIGFVGKAIAIIFLIKASLMGKVLAIPVLIALIFLSASGIIYGLKYLSTYYGGYRTGPGKILKYYLLNVSEKTGVLFNIVLSIIIPLVLVGYNIIAEAIMLINIIGILGVSITYVILRRTPTRVEELWLGGARP